MIRSFYVAGTYRRRAELAQLAESLQVATGWKSTARWLLTPPDSAYMCPNHTGNGCLVCGGSGDVAEHYPEAAARFARNDLQDVAAAGVLIAVTECPGAPGAGRGGRHVELGYALGLNISVVVFGPAENIFTHLAVAHASTFTQLVARIKAIGGDV